MWYEIFKFELKYRFKRPETYLFFVFLLAFSVFGMDFIFQGVELGLVKLNAPIVIGKTMGAITGIFMILSSMIMGMPMIRDDQYHITSLIYTTPIRKFDLLLGRFLGSFLILLLIFCAIPLGMMAGEFLPWHFEAEMNSFSIAPYATLFPTIMLPTLFFGAALFFVTGTLSRSLLVVYTQGIIIFVIFFLTKSITNDYLQAVMDPFSLTTITQLSKDWTVVEKNTLLLSFSGVLLVNKMFWISIGILVMCFGYFRFNFSILQKSRKPSKSKISFAPKDKILDINLPNVIPQYGLRSQVIQFFTMSKFYCKSLLKETSFWAIVICGIIIIIVNSISLGTVYGVDSYPTTYFIVEELQELSLYFFIIILLFYSGELYWMERGAGLNLMCDATPISSLVRLSSKVVGLIGVYIVLMFSLILSGIVFQIMKGYYHFDIPVYLTGFFIEILPFLVIYTFASFFIQSLVNSKFLGILITLIFFIVMIALQAMGYDHVLFSFGGGGLKGYSEMNGYGHFMAPYLLTKTYWVLFGMLLLIIASILSVRGVNLNLKDRLTKSGTNFTRKTKIFAIIILTLFILLGSYVFYQTHVLNEVWTQEEEQSYRANYEKSLKQFEYKSQPKIVEANLNIELYPDERSYYLEGEFTLKNDEDSPITEIHIQKLIESDILLDSVYFSESFTADDQYQEFEYIIYQLVNPLASGDSLKMFFKQVLKPKGLNTSGSSGSVLHNGTFIRNNEFPTLGYNKKYELRDEDEREQNGLEPRLNKAEIDDDHELQVARSGSDSHGVKTKITIGTNSNQTAITSGNFVKKWERGERNYCEYHANEPMINFYAILSGRYELLKDQWHPKKQVDENAVDLEIYYHPRHTYNLDRMIAGMKASLDYYSTNFSPYQYRQLRIVEFPRYEEFAQSFPNTIPFSESIGFMLDIDDSLDVDMTFFVTAHEIAHQWWGMQVETANVKGRNFVLETLSQYSALMVFKSQFSQTKVDQFLTLQKELYEKGRNKSKVEEVPLYLVENEEYIYYNKGAIAMYKLQELVGEDKVNLALRSFINDWNSKDGHVKRKTKRYATSEDLISYIVGNTAEEKRNEVVKLFKEISSF